MTELIKISYTDDTPAISGRELHDFLNIDTPYKQWFDRMCEYEFSENTDFQTILCESTGGRPSTDHVITIPMAKEICMIQRNEKGKQARRYFIEVEKKYRQSNGFKVPQTYAEALRLAAEQAEQIEVQTRYIAELKPKAEYFDAVIDSDCTISIGEAAKVLNLGIGPNRLFEFLRCEGVLMQNNQPYQKYIDRGYFRTTQSKYTKPDGSIHTYRKPVVFQKGLDFIRRLYIDAQGHCIKTQ